MNSDQKFLAAAGAALTLLIVYPVAPCAVILLAAGLLVVAWAVVNQHGQR